MEHQPHGIRPRADENFGHLLKLFPATPAPHDIGQLISLAAHMSLPPEAALKDEPDDEENPMTPAGYTYFGQMIDHDLSFDTHSNFDRPGSFAAATNARTPALDLDCLYGRGPDDQPYLYEGQGDGRTFTGKLLLGQPFGDGAHDLPRNPEGRAIIGDPRNDENLIVSQLHGAFMAFHNRMVDRVRHDLPDEPGRTVFEEARRRVRHHYQRIIIDDFLPRVVDIDSPLLHPFYAALAARRMPSFTLYDLARGSYMPVEFAAAAYRFGHSMVRPFYRMNAGKQVFIFGAAQENLRGFRAVTPDFRIDWKLFFHPTLKAGHEGDLVQAGEGATRVQFAYRIDPMVVSPLFALPASIASNPASLPERNLRRGLGFGLPSGEWVAERLGGAKLPPGKLAVRTFTAEGGFDAWKPISDIDPGLANNTPLWFYILAEAQADLVAEGDDGARSPVRLRDVGGAIVLETFAGFLYADRESVVNDTCFRSINGRKTFTMVELMREIGAMPAH